MTAPWLAPDGRAWGARRRFRVLLPDASAYGLYPPKRTQVARAARLLCNLQGSGPLASVALWSLQN